MRSALEKANGTDFRRTDEIPSKARSKQGSFDRVYHHGRLIHNSPILFDMSQNRTITSASGSTQL